MITCPTTKPCQQKDLSELNPGGNEMSDKPNCRAMIMVMSVYKVSQTFKLLQYGMINLISPMILSTEYYTNIHVPQHTIQIQIVQEQYDIRQNHGKITTRNRRNH